MSDDKEPIKGKINNTEFSVSVEELKIDNELTVEGIQVKIDSIDLLWFIHQYKGYWRNTFVHTPDDIEDKLPPNMCIVESSDTIWTQLDKTRNNKINKALRYCGLDKNDIEIAIKRISESIIENNLMDDFSMNISDDPYLCQNMVLDAEIDYSYPFWFMIEKKFSAKAVAERVIHLFSEQHHRIKTVKETKKILIFNDGIYVNGEDEVEKMIRDLLHHRATIHYDKEVKDEVRTHTLTLLSLFNPGNYVNLQNGVYMINYKTFRNADEGVYDDKDMMFLYKLPVHYDVNATCPGITKFFEWALPDAVHREQVYEEFAYAFAPGHPIQRMFLHFGSGKNGKGVATTILRHIIGGENISGWSAFNLEYNNDYCQANMVTKKYNICGDMPSNKIPFDFIKGATGGDIMPVREIKKEPYNVINSCKILFMMNNVPVILDFSDGPLRRIIVTVWEVQVKDKDIDPLLSKKLTTDSELSGFFDVLMDSYDELMERGHFIYNPTTEQTEATLTELRGEDVDSFIAEKCVVGNGQRYDRKAMYEDYAEWHKSRMAVPKGKKIFNSFIKRLGYNSVRYAHVWVWDGIGKLEKGQGIKISLGLDGKVKNVVDN